MIVCTASPAFAQNLLTSNTDLATAGYFQLSWQASASSPSYRLQQSADSDFSNAQTIYQGTDTASVLSGLSDGRYYFRVLDHLGTPSNIVTVQVKHHSLSKAFGFFALGACMFVILLVVLLTASRQKESA